MVGTSKSASRHGIRKREIDDIHVSTTVRMPTDPR
jgi:hypothetical protein